MRTTTQVSCNGSSDNVLVEIPEFTRTLDAAVRIARSFDAGASECGLVCDPRFLALDLDNDPYNDAKNTTPGRQGASDLAKFPCHWQGN